MNTSKPENEEVDVEPWQRMEMGSESSTGRGMRFFKQKLSSYLSRIEIDRSIEEVAKVACLSATLFFIVGIIIYIANYISNNNFTLKVDIGFLGL